jgi:hypothetical protein
VAVTASPGAGRVLIAVGGGPLAAEPSWTRFDNITACRNYGYDCYAGRQTEFDTTDTGTATVYFHDQDGSLDDSALVGCQVMLQLYNPVTAAWHIRWRGHIDQIDRTIVDTPGAALADTALQCVGIFDYLGGVKFLPGVHGDIEGVAPAGMTGVVFYEDERVDDRIIALLTDADIATTMRVVFTGNVDVNETLYDPDDVILQAVRDAADAEWPGVANFYEDRFGRAVFHGRFARFDPEGTAAEGNWDFNSWAAGTREDSPAQVREFSYNIPRARIINSYLAWPKEDENGAAFDRDDIKDMLKTDGASISAYGYRGQEAPDLIIKENFNNSNTGAEECELMAQWYVDNYSQPRLSVQSVAIGGVAPGDSRAATTWDLCCRADVSDRLSLTIDEAGLGGTAFFIDGIRVECRVANPLYDHVTVTPNLTPADYYGNPEEA